ncbi:murein hydrolase activator EnvC family protein [Alkalicoccobacillus plakortidis]|uniref:Peptidoglycan DD-metalloendopeptidase family protein n=1 Tax=Alkalicoccobacillus plakortidis TaxID=444060 RepID=A0ABT0XIF0_9BACI|nr:M23 family metallopeptidase [Alkalicoccobacillus plakortidis]MCM2675681.1 peptidoglycan DD-metalloendopeptidase family protein [Alkalicoccobacillus plakortidis]
MKKKVGYITLAAAIAFGSVGFGGLTNTALANEDLRNKISDVQGERGQNQELARQKEAEVADLKQEMEVLSNEIRELEKQEADTAEKISEKEAEIAEVEAHIEQLKEEIKEIEERIAERDELLKDRAKNMYQSGGEVNYLEVILGAKDFGDLLDRVNALSTIANQDKSILDAHIQDHEDLEAAKQEVEEELSNLEGHLEDLEILKADLEGQRSEKDSKRGDLQSKEDKLEAELGEIENEDEILAQQEAAFEKELADWEAEQKRLAEEKKRQEEAEKKRQEEAEKARVAQESADQEAAQQSSNSSSSSSSNSSSSSSSNSSSESSRSEASPQVKSQTASSEPAAEQKSTSGFVRPTTGSVTSTYGQRWGKMHHGIDFGKNGRTGDVPIVAAKEGTVSSAGWMNGYGNTVIITHVVDGRTVTTLYGHMERIDVSAGQKVSQSQQIGLMGNTGQSFGAHLHFEVHEGSLEWF